MICTKSNIIATAVAAVVLSVSVSHGAKRAGTIGNGSAYCEQQDLIVDGRNGAVRIPREQSAFVPTASNIVAWHCGGGNGQINNCPIQTNQLYVHRQKADNPEWLYDCQVARVSKKKRKVLLIDGAPRIAPTPNK